MQAFATDIAVYIACPSCSQTGLVDQSTLSAARMRRAQVTLTCHACGERFDATEAQEVILPHVPQETLDLPLTARTTIDAEAETQEPEPRYARASDHEPLTRYQSLHDVWRHLGAEAEDDDADDIVPTLPSWLQKKDNGESANAEPSTPPKAAETASQNDDISMGATPDAASKTDDATDDADADATAAPEQASDDLTGLAGKLARPDTTERIVDLTTIEQHLPVLPEVGAIEAEWEKPDNAQQLNWPLAIFGAMVLVIGLLAGALFF